MVVRLCYIWVGGTNTAIYCKFAFGTCRKNNQGIDQSNSREVFRGFVGGHREDAQGWSYRAAYCGGPSKAPEDKTENPWAQNARLVPENKVQGVQDWKEEPRPESKGEGTESTSIIDGKKARPGERGIPEVAGKVQDDVAVHLVYEDKERVAPKLQSLEIKQFLRDARELKPGR